MAEKPNRRRFLESSLAAGTVLGLTNGTSDGFIGRAMPPDDNPRVRPGRVNWHADFGAACAASRASHKPVFLFHMLGRLDQRFC